MSDLIFPIATISEVKTTIMDSVVTDVMEGAANIYTRDQWGGKFRRALKVSMPVLFWPEREYLEGFYHARGRWDDFWFIDNTPLRSGSYKVRFASALEGLTARGNVATEVELVEVAPVIPLHGPELQAELSRAFSVWLDASRERYQMHLGTVLTNTDTLYDVLRGVTFTGVGPVGGSGPAQYRFYQFYGGSAITSAANLTGFSGAQPACALFAFVKCSTTATKQVLFHFGTPSSGAALGLVLSAANVFEPWIGGTEVWTGCVQSNGTADTWRSIALDFPSGSNTVTMYVNGVSVGTGTNTRSFTNGAFCFGAANNSSLFANPGGTMTNCNVNDVIVSVNPFLGAAGVKALHNKLCHKYGLAQVA